MRFSAADSEQIRMRGFRYLADQEALAKWRFGATAKGKAKPEAKRMPKRQLALTQFAERIVEVGGERILVMDVD